MCECKVGPGKFEGEPASTFMAWEHTMLGSVDVSTGEGGRTVDWLRAPLNLDADASVVKAALAYGYCRACVDEAGQDVRGGMALWESDHGFVYARVFVTREEFDRALDRAQAADEAAEEKE